MTIPVSVLILTRNEEANLPRCLGSLKDFKDVVVLDSHSTDQTRDIATAAGARVVTRRFDGYAGQRNYGLTEIPYRHPWLLMVDADETVPKELCLEIETAVKTAAGEVCQFRMRRKDFFLGRCIRRSSGSTWFGRLMRLGRARVVRDVNEQYETDGEFRSLRGYLHHFPFAQGLAHWVDKHNRYSSMEAAIMLHDRRRGTDWRELFAADPMIRRKALKAIVYRHVAARPLFYFIWSYILRGGFVEGRAGLKYCLLKSYAEFITDCKYHEACMAQSEAAAAELTLGLSRRYGRSGRTPWLDGAANEPWPTREEQQPRSAVDAHRHGVVAPRGRGDNDSHGWD